MPKRDERAPFHVQLRDYERQLISTTLHACNGSFVQAATILGIGVRFLRARARQLGGILGDERNEPPKPIWPKKAPEK